MKICLTPAQLVSLVLPLGVCFGCALALTRRLPFWRE